MVGWWRITMTVKRRGGGVGWSLRTAIVGNLPAADIPHFKKPEGSKRGMKEGAGRERGPQRRGFRHMCLRKFV